jgi:hypothetical protein
MIDAENYVVTELIVWYQQKIDKEEVPNQTNVEPSEEIKNGL